jgi:hypothetical protein
MASNITHVNCSSRRFDVFGIEFAQLLEVVENTAHLCSILFFFCGSEFQSSEESYFVDLVAIEHRGLGDEGTGGLGDWETGKEIEGRLNLNPLFTIHYPLSPKNKYRSESVRWF